jgi:hypothetical protein
LCAFPSREKKRVGTVRKVTSYISSRRFFFPRGANGQQKSKEEEEEEEDISMARLITLTQKIFI